MASDSRSFTVNRRPTALEVTQSKNEQIESDIPGPTSDSSGEEQTQDVQEYVNKLEEQNGVLEEELIKLRRLTAISLPGSLLKVIFPDNLNSSLFKDRLSSIIQNFCNEYRDELKKDDAIQNINKDKKLISVEFNDTFSLERTPTISSNDSATNTPKYSQLYTRIVQPKNTKNVPNDTGELIVKPLIRLDSSQPNRPAPKCFNCEGNHHLRNCKEVRDMNKIRANKQEYLNAQGGDQQNRISNNDQDNSNPETSMSKREEFKHPQSYNTRESYRREPYHHEVIEMRPEQPPNYYNNHQHTYPRGRSHDRDERVYHGSRHNHHHFSSEDRNYSHNSYSSSERDVHRRITSTPNKSSDRDVRKVDIRDKLDSGEYSNTYADMDLSDQDPELEEGEIANRSPRHYSRTSMPPYNPYYSHSPPTYESSPHDYYNHPRNSHTITELRREPPRNPKYQHSNSMPDIRVGIKRRLSRRSPHSTDTNQDSSDTSGTFKTNEHNFSLDFPPGIVTPDSMRAPERFNSIRRIIDRRK